MVLPRFACQYAGLPHFAKGAKYDNPVCLFQGQRPSVGEAAPGLRVTVLARQLAARLPLTSTGPPGRTGSDLDQPGQPATVPEGGEVGDGVGDFQVWCHSEGK